MWDRLVTWLINRRPADHKAPLGMLWELFNFPRMSVGLTLFTDSPSGETNLHPYDGICIVLRGAIIRHVRTDRPKQHVDDYVYTDTEGQWLCWRQEAGDVMWWKRGQAHRMELPSPRDMSDRILHLAWMSGAEFRANTQCQAVVLTVLFHKRGEL